MRPSHGENRNGEREVAPPWGAAVRGGGGEAGAPGRVRTDALPCRPRLDMAGRLSGNGWAGWERWTEGGIVREREAEGGKRSGGRPCHRPS